MFPGIRDCICSLASKCYRVTLDECSLVGASMLDLFVWKGLRFDASGALDFRPYIKPTARHIPLINSSRHLPSIHTGWPKAEIMRMHRLSLHAEDFEWFKRIKLDRFTEFGISELVLKSCADWIPLAGSQISKQCFVPRVVTRGVRCVLPYHGGLYRGLPALAHEIGESWNLMLRNCNFESALNLGFKNSGLPLGIVLRRNVSDK